MFHQQAVEFRFASFCCVMLMYGKLYSIFATGLVKGQNVNLSSTLELWPYTFLKMYNIPRSLYFVFVAR